MTKVGFVGVGRMGANMARRLRDKEYCITAVQDHNQEIAEALSRELGCQAAPHPVRVAELSDVNLTVVSDDAAMRTIYAGDGSSGLLTFVGKAGEAAKVNALVNMVMNGSWRAAKRRTVWIQRRPSE